MNKSIKKIIQIAIGLIIILLIFNKIGTDQIFRVLKTINPLWLIPSFLMSFLIQSAAVINIKIMLESINKKVDFRYLFKAITLSQSLSLVLPSKIGEFSSILFLKRRQIEYGEGLAIMILDKIISLFVTATIALIGVLLFLNSRLFIVLLIGCIASCFLIIYSIRATLIRNLIKRSILKNYAGYFTGFSKNFEYIISKKKSYLVLNIIVTVVKLIITVPGYWFIFKAFGQPVHLYHILFICTITDIISLIPISLSGLGLKEGSGTYLYYIITGISTAISMNVMIIGTIRKYLVALFFYIINLDILDTVKLRKK